MHVSIICFFLLLIIISWYVCQNLFNRSPLEEYQGCFHLLATTNQAGMTILVHDSECNFLFFCNKSKSTIAGSSGNCTPSFIRNYQTDFSEWLDHCIFPPATCKLSGFSLSLPAFCVVSMFYFSQSHGCVVIFHCGLNLNFPNV